MEFLGKENGWPLEEEPWIFGSFSSIKNRAFLRDFHTKIMNFLRKFNEGPASEKLDLKYILGPFDVEL